MRRRASSRAAAWCWLSRGGALSMKHRSRKAARGLLESRPTEVSDCRRAPSLCRAAFCRGGRCSRFRADQPDRFGSLKHRPPRKSLRQQKRIAARARGPARRRALEASRTRAKERHAARTLPTMGACVSGGTNPRRTSTRDTDTGDGLEAGLRRPTSPRLPRFAEIGCMLIPNMLLLVGCGRRLASTCEIELPTRPSASR